MSDRSYRSFFDVRCDCGAVYHAGIDHIGRRIRCTSCGRVVEIKSSSQGPHSLSPRVESSPSKAMPGYTRRTPVPKVITRAFKWWLVAGCIALLAVIVTVVMVGRDDTGLISGGTSQADTSSPAPPLDVSPVGQPNGSLGASSSQTALDDGQTLCPDSPRSMPTGKRLRPDLGTSGLGRLSIDNGTA